MLQLVPGPVSIPPEVLAVYAQPYASSDLEDEFFEDYAKLQRELQVFLHTNNDMVIMMGEAMVCLWGALKSVLSPGDKVVAVSNGLYGHGIGEMAKGMGADVTFIESDWDIGIDPKKVCEVVAQVRPKLVTAVHCETPSGILNPLDGIGVAVHAVGGLFYVDFVSSAGGAPVHVDNLSIDLGLLGSQKVLSCAPDVGIVSVSDAAWEIIANRNYQGYDALLPFRTAVSSKYMPYTFSWGSIRAISLAVSMATTRGLQNDWARHEEVAAHCRRRIEAMGLKVYTRSHHSPTITAVCVPDDMAWADLDKALRQAGVVVGGSYGKLAGKVFRIGHMGHQANRETVDRGLDAIHGALQALKN